LLSRNWQQNTDCLPIFEAFAASAWVKSYPCLSGPWLAIAGCRRHSEVKRVFRLPPFLTRLAVFFNQFQLLE
jgi:hypothetical protein